MSDPFLDAMNAKPKPKPANQPPANDPFLAAMSGTPTRPTPAKPARRGLADTLKEGAVSAVKTGWDVIQKPADVFNTVTHTATEQLKAGRNPLEALGEAARQGVVELQDIHHHQGPSYVQDLLPPNASPRARTAATWTDLAADFLLNPGNKVSAAATSKLPRLLKPLQRPLVAGTTRLGEKLAPELTNALRAERAGTEALRAAQRQAEIAAAKRRVALAQIHREAGALANTLRKADPAFDQIVRQTKENPVLELAKRAALAKTPQEQAFLRQQARQIGAPVQIVEDLGKRLAASPDPQAIRELSRSEVLARLAGNGNAVSHAPRPGFEALPRTKALGPLAGKHVAPPVARFLASEVDPTIAASRAAASKNLITRANDFLDEAARIEEMAARSAPGRAVTGVVALRKKILLSRTGTQVRNIAGNLAASELALQSNGIPLASYAKATPGAMREFAGFLRTGKMGPTLTELSQHSTAFTEVFERELMNAAQKTPGTGGKVLRAGNAAVMVPTTGEALRGAGNAFLGFQGMAEQAAKLSLYRALRTRMSPERAAAEMERFLFNYSDRHFVLRGLDRWGAWLFNAWPVKAGQLAFETLATKPALVARVPRLQAGALQATGRQAEYDALPDYRKNWFVMPAGEGRFVDLSGVNLAADTVEAAKATARAVKEGRLPDLPDVAGVSMAAPFLEQRFNQKLFSDPDNPIRIAEPGAPPEEKKKARWGEFMRSVLPQLGDIRRVKAAKQGLALSDSRTSEAQTVGEAVAQAVFGVPTFHGAPADVKARTKAAAPDIRERARAAKNFLGAVKAEAAGQPNPYTRSLSNVTDADALRRQEEHALGYLKKQMQSPAIIDREGNIGAEGKARLTRAYQHLLAIHARRKELAREQAGQR